MEQSCPTSCHPTRTSAADPRWVLPLGLSGHCLCPGCRVLCARSPGCCSPRRVPAVQGGCMVPTEQGAHGAGCPWSRMGAWCRVPIVHRVRGTGSSTLGCQQRGCLGCMCGAGCAGARQCQESTEQAAGAAGRPCNTLCSGLAARLQPPPSRWLPATAGQASRQGSEKPQHPFLRRPGTEQAEIALESIRCPAGPRWHSDTHSSRRGVGGGNGCCQAVPGSGKAEVVLSVPAAECWPHPGLL